MRIEEEKGLQNDEHSESTDEDIMWFSQQIQMEHLKSDYFFEEYLVVGGSLKAYQAELGL